MTERTGQRPCTAAEAVQRARSMINRGGAYILGTGSYAPQVVNGVFVDVPWTKNEAGLVGSDCAGFAICWAYKLRRHRPGFASGRVPDEYRDQSDVDDDLNCNSLIEDALTVKEICEPVTEGVPQPGDLLTYPSLRLHLKDGSIFKTIGHVGIVIGNWRAVTEGWDWKDPPYHNLDIAQCKGPNGRTPGVIATDGSVWSMHDDRWPKPAHRTVVIRMRA